MFGAYTITTNSWMNQTLWIWHKYSSCNKSAHYSGLLRVIHPSRRGFYVMWWLENDSVHSFPSDRPHESSSMCHHFTNIKNRQKKKKRYFAYNSVCFVSISSFSAQISRNFNWNYTANGGQIKFVLLNKQLKEDIPCLAFVFAHRKKMKVWKFCRMDERWFSWPLGKMCIVSCKKIWNNNKRNITKTTITSSTKTKFSRNRKVRIQFCWVFLFANGNVIKYSTNF